MSAKEDRPDTLETYRKKRDFAVTPEPEGERARQRGRAARFVVQRHRARRLHYDFRLEIDGALASWAVPKGPTLDPSARRAAFHVEDHPIEYLDFEGVIPGGQYGAGDVIVWDRGTFHPADATDPAEAVAGGELHFDLHGEKLKGRFVLVRTSMDRRDDERWLLLHKHDDAAEKGWDPEDHLQSVKSGRTNEQVAADPSAIWRSDLPADQAEVPVTAQQRPPKVADSKDRAKRTRRHRGGGEGPTPGELTALDHLGHGGRWELGGSEVRLSNLDKVLFPPRGDEEPITKRDLIGYYASVAPVMLPYLEDRPVHMHRYPNGVTQPGFWHKQVPRSAPEWLNRWHDPQAKGGKTSLYALIDSPPALAWMANYAAIELHPWAGRIPHVERPTWAYIDIDPGTATSPEETLALARLFRTGLDHLGVRAMPKLTGSRGIHIWIPIEPRYSFRQTSDWVERLSRAVGATVPDLVSWNWQKKDRRGRARLDYTQNAPNKTLVAPYSVRAAPGAPISLPIAWEELDDPGLRSDRFGMMQAIERLAKSPDAFSEILGYEQQLPPL